MNKGIWQVILVVAISMGFLIGYSLPPMLEVGMIGSDKEQPAGLKSEINEEMEQYYQDLLNDQD